MPTGFNVMHRSPSRKERNYAWKKSAESLAGLPVSKSRQQLLGGRSRSLCDRGKAESPEAPQCAEKGFLCTWHGAAQFRWGARAPAGFTKGWTWRPCGRIYVAGASDSPRKEDEGRGDRRGRGVDKEGEEGQDCGGELSRGGKKADSRGQKAKEKEKKVVEPLARQKEPSEEETQLQSRFKERLLREEFVEQCKFDASSQTEVTQVPRDSLPNAGGPCGREVGSGHNAGRRANRLPELPRPREVPCVFPTLPQASVGSEVEGQQGTLPSVTLAGPSEARQPGPADVLSARLMAVETAGKQGWNTARYLEVLDEGDESSAPAHVLLAAQKHCRLVEKAGGKGSWSRQSGWYSYDWQADQRQKGKGKDAKGKGKKGKNKGKGGKGAWANWGDEKPKGGEPPGGKKDLDK